MRATTAVQVGAVHPNRQGDCGPIEPRGRRDRR